MNFSLRKLGLFTLLNLITLSAFAWDHSVEVGAGFSHDPNNIHYNNYGFLLSGDILPIAHTPVSFWSITGSLGHFRTNAPSNNSLTTAAASLALRLYPITCDRSYSPYLLGSAGPAIMSSRKFGVNTQASNLTIQTNLGVGVEHGHYDLNLRLEHFSNAGLAKPNEGFNVLYLLSLGYLF